MKLLYIFRSKTSIAEFLVYCKRVGTKSANSRKKAKSNRKLVRPPYVCDFICLQFLCQVCPDDGFDFEALIDLENESKSQRCYSHHGQRYQEVVKEFKRLEKPKTDNSTTPYDVDFYSLN